MHSNSLSFLLFLTISISAILAVPALADNMPEISREKAAEIARQHYGGELLDVRGAGQGYRVKLIKDGRVRVLHVDKKTGEVR